MSHLKCSSVGILLVLVLLSYSCSFAFGEVGCSKEEMTLSEKVNVVSLCWKSARESLVIGCSEILVGEEELSRFAWNLTDCVRKDIGDQPFPYCDVKSPMKDCVKKLDDDAHMMYLDFYRKTSDICLLLQTGAALKRQMEIFVKELKRGTMQQEQMIVEVDNKQQEVIELEEQLNKVQEKLELMQESLPLVAEKLYVLHEAHETRLQKLRDDFIYGEYDGHHTYNEGDDKSTFWGSIAEDYAAVGPPSGFQGLISWLFLPSVALGMYLNLPGEYLYIGAAIFIVIFCIIEMDKPSEAYNFEPQIYNMERGARDKLISDYNTMDIWDFNEKYGELWDFTVTKDDIMKR